MTPPNLGLYITCLLMSSAASTILHQQSFVQLFGAASVGGNVSLPCLCQDDEAVMFYWYKQTLGQVPTLVSTFYKHRQNNVFHGEFENNPRFSLDTGKQKHHLTISGLRISDSATYYCVKSNLYDFEFCEGMTVDVKKGSNVPALVHQSVSGSLHPGGSVTLNCTVHTGTCDGQHSVYWFKDSGQTPPGIIYTQGDRNDQCERKPDRQNHNTSSCIYNLPVNNLSPSHAGTYYCAVASCGHILFGKGTKLDFEDSPGSLVLVYFLSAVLAFTTSLVVLLAFCVYKMYKDNGLCTEQDSNVTSPTANAEDEENLHYAALRDHKVNGSRKQRDETIMSECVYSSVKE